MFLTHFLITFNMSMLRTEGILFRPSQSLLMMNKVWFGFDAKVDDDQRHIHEGVEGETDSEAQVTTHLCHCFTYFFKTLPG